MSDFITSISSVAALRTWWDSTVPATVASGDNYIAELAAGSYDLNTVSGTWGGKTVSGSIIIRPQTAAKLNATTRALRAASGDGVYLSVPNTSISFTSAHVVFDGVQIASGGAPSATLSLSTGGIIQRCIVSDVKLTFDNNGGSILDSACLRSQSDVCAWLPNSCTVTGSTFVHFAGGTAVATGTAITSKNNIYVSIGGSAAFSGSMDGSSSVNRFNVGTTYGSSASTITPANEFVDVSSISAADLRLKSGTSLGSGAVAGQGTGTDVYYQTRAGSIGANEYASGGGGGSTQNVTVATSTQANHATAAAIYQAGVGTGTLTSAKLENNTGTVYANISNWTARIKNPTTDALVVEITGLTTSAYGVLTMTHALIVPGTDYACEYIHPTYGRILPVLTAA